MSEYALSRHAIGGHYFDTIKKTEVLESEA